MADGISKGEMEDIILGTFLELHNVRLHPRLTFLQKRERPDYEVTRGDENDVLGIEITVAILDSENDSLARKTYRRSDTILEESDFLPENEIRLREKTVGNPLDAIKGNSSALAPKITERIHEKSALASSYGVEYELFLLVGIGTHVFGINSVNWSEVAIPNEHPFSEIWVNAYDCVREDQNGIARVWPEFLLIPQGASS